MNKTPLLSWLLLFCLSASSLMANHPSNWNLASKLKSSNFVAGCHPAMAQTDLDINNVRARLLTGGDLWWDRHDAGYIVPKPLPGQPEVSAIFAAGIWMGGFDNGGNLKVACQTYGNNQNLSDYWPGPLSGFGETTEDECNNWDRFFEVKGTDILEHLQKYQASINGGPAYTADQIPEAVKKWPAKGNPYFFEINQFNLPITDQGLAAFEDNNFDGIYEPLDGDFPIIENRGCNYSQIQFPDQMIFWIYNDEGGGTPHGETHGIPIRMEVHATAFAYSTLDQINDVTFQQHKLINRAAEDIDSFYFALWVDPDLGCYRDDFIGCSPERNMSYWYNKDDVDGEPGITCGGINTYGTHIPAVGIDIFRGLIGENGDELGMSSFTYWNLIGPSSDPFVGTIGPSSSIEFYRYLSGSWRDGTPFSFGGSGYNPSSTNVFKFAFPDPPNDPSGWSMCHPGSPFSQGLPDFDRVTIQSCGPTTLQPGAVDEIIFGVVFAPNIDYPCPDLSRLFAADDFVQAWFDNCDIVQLGPDAPDVDWIAGDRKITGILTNSIWSNNAQEDFETVVVGHPKWATDPTYNFEGYLVYQIAGPEFTMTDIYDTTKARLVFQCDFENEFSEVRNWEAYPNPDYQIVPGAEQFLYAPTEFIQGKNAGIQHEFNITEDLFAKGSDRRLINHRNYYYIALAYAANEFLPFNATNGMGQKTMYIIGTRNIGPDGTSPSYEVLPRPAQNGLEDVQIVPNPFYNSSAYADGNGNGVLKIINLPAKCEVNIYSLDGYFVRHFSRNEVPAPPYGSGVPTQQIYPDLIWDLRNEHGKTMASGIYLVRIQAPEFGEITLKAVVI